MKRLLAAGLLSVGMVHVAYSQSLDIGGIELRVGQKVDDALRSLSHYQVQYVSSSWFVSQKVGKQHQHLGAIGAKANVVSFISKHYQLDENEDSQTTYTLASKELRRRGGKTCSTSEVEYTDGLIRSFQTDCGAYELTYMMPGRGDSGKYQGSISISVRSR